MALNREKLAQVAKPRSEAAMERAKARKANREWVRLSQDIALALHYYIRKTDINQKELADKLGVSAVYVGKLLKGSENLTLETISKIQNVIGETIISVAKPYNNCMIVEISQMPRFSANAAISEKYHGGHVSQNEYASVMECVA